MVEMGKIDAPCNQLPSNGFSVERSNLPMATVVIDIRRRQRSKGEAAEGELEEHDKIAKEIATFDSSSVNLPIVLTFDTSSVNLPKELIVIDGLLSTLVGIEEQYISIKKVCGMEEDGDTFQIDASMDLELQEPEFQPADILWFRFEDVDQS